MVDTTAVGVVDLVAVPAYGANLIGTGALAS
jgi:hypothetical protein